MAGDDADWKAPPSGTKWTGPLKAHLRDGGYDGLRNSEGIAARVSGEAGRIPPRTFEDGVVLKAFLHRLLPSQQPDAFELAITTHSSLFSTRPDAAHATLPTAYRYKIAPLSRVMAQDEPPLPLATRSAGWMPPFCWGRPTLAVNAGWWLFNITKKVSASTGYFFLQGAFLRLAWVYPMASLPLCVGCISFAMTDNDVSAYDLFLFVSHSILDATMVLGSMVADRLGEPAGRIITTVDTVYAALFTLALALLAMGLLSRALLRNLHTASHRGYSVGSSAAPVSNSTSTPVLPSPALIAPPWKTGDQRGLTRAQSQVETRPKV